MFVGSCSVAPRSTLILSTVRDAIGGAVYFGGWEPWKLFWNMEPRKDTQGFFTDFVGGAMMGTAGWVSVSASDQAIVDFDSIIRQTYALDTAKTRYQREFIRLAHSNGPRPSYPPLNLRTLLTDPRAAARNAARKYGLIAWKPPPRARLPWATFISRDSYKGQSTSVLARNQHCLS